ncbi:MAG: hypothetical protein ACJAVV_002331 [Alphaproteobacteria bacterium]|jgi:hypothetical protein
MAIYWHFAIVFIMKVVVDTHIIINTLLSPSWSSASFRVFKICLMGKLVPQIGASLFAE